MNETVNVLCYKSKTLSNGEHPLMICVSKNGKRTYKSLGVSVNPTYWDFDKNKPKRFFPAVDILSPAKPDILILTDLDEVENLQLISLNI